MRLGLQINDFSRPVVPAHLCATLVEIAQTAERCGFDRVGVADHFWQHPVMGGPEAAELRGDTAFLEYTLADDFAGIGPRGFMLTGEQWLARYESGDLKHESFLLDDVQVRIYEDAAVMTGRETIKGKYKDHGVEGQFRTTLVFVKQQGRRLLATLHLSPRVEGS